jgi:hypothetical protein
MVLVNFEMIVSHGFKCDMFKHLDFFLTWTEISLYPQTHQGLQNSYSYYAGFKHCSLATRFCCVFVRIVVILLLIRC